jgi:hypothetical protein
MLEYNKIQTMNGVIEDENTGFLPRVKIKDIIKFNLSVAYFIVLTFLIAKLILA